MLDCLAASTNKTQMSMKKQPLSNSIETKLVTTEREDTFRHPMLCLANRMLDQN